MAQTGTPQAGAEEPEGPTPDGAMEVPMAPLPELRASRQAGWIFHGEECVAVERRFDDTGRLAAVRGD